jgi:pilus assembly protein CpaE
MLDETELRGQCDIGENTRPFYSRMQISPSIVLICPDEAHRRMLTRALEAQHAAVVSSLSVYPSYNNLLSIVDLDCDAFLIELDTDSDNALDLVETLCSRKPATTVMVYSGKQNQDLLLASMRAGAREFLFGPIAPNVLGDALLRGAARRAEHSAKKTRGKVFMFWGAKGGSGITTLATNFAIALHHETGSEVVLADLHPQLGDVAVLLGLTPRFTIAEAFLDPKRLDEEFLSTLVTKHSSGISVLAAPDSYTSAPIDERSVGSLIEVVQNRFSYAVVDAGLSLGIGAEPLFQLADTLYLVTQLDIPSLRNSQRFISYLRRFSDLQIELVLNRFESRKLEFDDERLTKAVGLSPKWRIPNDYAAVRRAANTGTPLIADKSPVSQTLCQMARSACGNPATNDRKKGFKLFG